MANQTANDLIRMVDLFLRSHPGARPALGQRNAVGNLVGAQNRFSHPWCADWAEAMDAWISVAINAPARNHPSLPYIRLQWGQANNNGQHNFIVMSPVGHNIQLSTPGNAAVDPVILLFDPWRDLLPRFYPAVALTQGGNTAPTEMRTRQQLAEMWYWDHRNDARFRETQLGLGPQ